MIFDVALFPRGIQIGKENIGSQSIGNQYMFGKFRIIVCSDRPDPVYVGQKHRDNALARATITGSRSVPFRRPLIYHGPVLFGCIRSRDLTLAMLELMSAVSPQVSSGSFVYPYVGIDGLHAHALFFPACGDGRQSGPETTVPL